MSPVSGVSVVVPVYRSDAILPELALRLGNVLHKITANYQLVLVNDGSPDNSWEVIGQLQQQYAWIQAINLMRNYGQHNALLCGIRAASYDVIVTMDDDLQNPPEEIPKLLATIAEGYDVVYGTPESEEHGFLRDVASVVTKTALQSAMGAKIARQVSAFRAFRTEVAGAFSQYEGSFVSIDVLLTWGTNRFAATPVRHEPRKQGSSSYTFRKLITHIMNMMIGFSTLPLQLASMVGFAFTLFGITVLVYVLARYFIRGGGVPGFPFLASIIALFSGAQLFALGIMGEYLARMHFRMIDRPSYAIRELRRHQDGDLSAKILESFRDTAIAAVDRQWRFVYANKAAASLLNRSLPDVLGRTVPEVFSDDDGSKLLSQFRRVVTGGQPQHFEHQVDRCQQYYAFHCYPGGEGLVFNFNDITENKRQEALRPLPLWNQDDEFKRIFSQIDYTLVDHVRCYVLHQFAKQASKLPGDLARWESTREARRSCWH